MSSVRNTSHYPSKLKCKNKAEKINTSVIPNMVHGDTETNYDFETIRISRGGSNHDTCANIKHKIRFMQA